MKSQWQLSATGAAVCFVAALSGCGGNTASTESNSSASTSGSNSATTSTSTNSASGGSTSLAGAGATFPAPLYTQWFDQYNKAKNVKIDYQAIGSGGGINNLTKQTVDFGASDAPLNAKEKAALRSPVVTIPSVAGAVVVVYNLAGAPKNMKMTGPALADIYLGKIKKWNDPSLSKINPGVSLPTGAINVVHRSDGSGTSYIFTGFLAAASPEWKDKVGSGKQVDWPIGLGGNKNDGVAKSVKGTPNSIGYVELAYAKQAQMTYASIQNKAGQFIEPTVEATTAAAEGAAAALQSDPTAPIANSPGAKAYPIAGFTYLMVYQSAKSPEKGAALKDFLKWAMTDGQKDAPALDYAPLPKAVADQNLKTIDALK